MNTTNQSTNLKSLISSVPCDGCTANHKKCNKILDQCSNCKRKGIKCTYLIVRRKRGPKTKSESMLEYCKSMYASLKLGTNTSSNSNQNPNIVNDYGTDNTLNYQDQLSAFSTYMNITNPMLYPSLVNSTNIQIPRNPLYQPQHITFQNFGAQMNWLPTRPQFDPFQTNLPQQAYMNPLLFPQQGPNQSESKNKNSNSTT
ncbi:hypothetical protein CONCODRAFT_3776 [Conidiobolus coronatus NRRL 28638]|uniref:Zn(2)-C6 fungal-type domain-containing protein n=1 Tax=Conidiobolus coronatus (strain ATCC 28846 / CBS 209.66 / NRRL 28638) TaxID=796925 RepID=A0A137PE70_CONC2|nr:hypothetical protein CONCODRAFT_3776 [Conidiobolus coronatus NRRL 28638]|eukprot:KXN73296.1 hypothetical protein CONCODRAFT_3776 [Conidiobolus coronatus NRRL 28638]